MVGDLDGSPRHSRGGAGPGPDLPVLEAPTSSDHKCEGLGTLYQGGGGVAGVSMGILLRGGHGSQDVNNPWQEQVPGTGAS